VGISDLNLLASHPAQVFYENATRPL